MSLGTPYINPVFAVEGHSLTMEIKYMDSNNKKTLDEIVNLGDAFLNQVKDFLEKERNLRKLISMVKDDIRQLLFLNFLFVPNE